MAVAKLISPISKQDIRKLRVAAYCRVSTSSADQLNSYATQVRYYTKLIQSKEEWELVEVFADEGISGMRADNRTEFQRMIRMCELKQIDLIITKSVSRFARNVPISLQYIRKLKALGIGIQFEKEGINTLALGDEMLLNTFAAISQEESQANSQHVRTSITKLMANGEFTPGNAPYGYRLVDSRLEIYEPEAQIIQWLFSKYLEGYSITEIANELINQKIPTKNGNNIWNPTNISYMLTNERYVGDCLYQKTFRESTVPFKRSKNRGEADMYLALNTHSGIIERDVYDKVQELLGKRKEKFSKITAYNEYTLTSKIRCSECGSYFHRKTAQGGIKWVCSKHKVDTKSCDSFYYSEERIYDGFLSMVNKLRFAPEDILGQTIAKLEYATLQYKRNNLSAKELSQSIADINDKILKLEQLRTKGYISPEVHQSQVRELQKKLSELKSERQDQFESRILTMLMDVKKLQSLIEEIEEPLETFDEKLFSEIIIGMEINKHDELAMTVLGGLKFTELI